MFNSILTWLRSVFAVFFPKEHDKITVFSYSEGFCFPPPLQCIDGETNEQYNRRSLEAANRRHLEGALSRNECYNPWFPESLVSVPTNRQQRRDRSTRVLSAGDGSSKPAVPYYIAQQSPRDRAKQLKSIGSRR